MKLSLISFVIFVSIKLSKCYDDDNNNDYEEASPFWNDEVEIDHFERQVPYPHYYPDSFKNYVTIAYEDVGQPREVICAGTLISRIFVLTSASCVVNRETNSLRVIPTVNPARFYLVRFAQIHLQFSVLSLNHDLALIIMTEPVDPVDFDWDWKFPRIRGSFDSEAQKNDVLVIAGHKHRPWPEKNHADEVIRQPLLVLEMQIIKTSECEEKFDEIYKHTLGLSDWKVDSSYMRCVRDRMTGLGLISYLDVGTALYFRQLKSKDQKSTEIDEEYILYAVASMPIPEQHSNLGRPLQDISKPNIITLVGPHREWIEHTQLELLSLMDFLATFSIGPLYLEAKTPEKSRIPVLMNSPGAPIKRFTRRVSRSLNLGRSPSPGSRARQPMAAPVPKVVHPRNSGSITPKSPKRTGPVRRLFSS